MAIDAWMLKHQAISIHSAELVISLDQFHKKITFRVSFREWCYTDFEYNYIIVQGLTKIIRNYG